MALPGRARVAVNLVTFAALVASFELTRSTTIEFFVGIAAFLVSIQAAFWLHKRHATTHDDETRLPREPQWARILYSCLVAASFDAPIGGWRGIHPVLAQLLFVIWVETHWFIVRRRRQTTVTDLPHESRRPWA
jgi:hypothetical protein